MAFAVNMDAWRLGNQDYWKTQAQENWAIENARAEAEAARRKQLFEDDQADRQRRFAGAETYGSGLTAPTTVEGSVPRMLQSVGTGEGLGPEFAQYERGYQAPAAAQNPAVSNAVEGPTAVTNNVTTPTGMKDPKVAAFVQKYGPMAEVAAKRLGVSPDAVLGQWGLETGWGQKVIPGTNNLGNIKNPQGVGVRATDNATGSRDAYTVYATPEEGATGYAEFIAGNQKRYGAALNTGDNSQAFFSGLKAGGYAEDPDYVRKGVAATDMVRAARGVAPSGVQSQALSRRNATVPNMATLPVEEPQSQPVTQVQAGPQLGLRSQPTNDEMGPRQPAEQRQMTVREDPRLAQIKLIGQEAMRKGDTATAAKMAETYHGIRLESEMGAISSQVLQMTPAQINALASRMGDDVNTGLRGMLLESKFDPATGLATVSVGDKKINLSRTDMAQIASGLYAIERGAVDAGYKAIASVNKSIADLAAQQNRLTTDEVRTNNDAISKKSYIDYQKKQGDAALIRANAADAKAKQAEDRQQAQVEFSNRIDGVLEGYQAAAAAGSKEAMAIYAREYDQLRATAGNLGLKVPPSIQAMQTAQKPQGDAKPIEAKEEGTRAVLGGQRVVADGWGGWLPEGAVLPSQRPMTVKRFGIEPNLADKLLWNRQDGKTVTFEGSNKAYDITNPNDVAELKSDYARLGRNTIAVDEAQKSSMNVQQRLRALGGNTPSPYDPPEVWSTYRATQNR